MTTETPFLTFWRAVNAVLEARSEQPATGGEIDLYAKFNKCNVAMADAVAWRITGDRWANMIPDYSALRAAQDRIDRERRDDFMNSERYP